VLIFAPDPCHGFADALRSLEIDFLILNFVRYVSSDLENKLALCWLSWRVSKVHGEMIFLAACVVQNRVIGPIGMIGVEDEAFEARGIYDGPLFRLCVAHPRNPP
jgi:hypothetical protein